MKVLTFCCLSSQKKVAGLVEVIRYCWAVGIKVIISFGLIAFWLLETILNELKTFFCSRIFFCIVV
jgi:hypothetical protein